MEIRLRDPKFLMKLSKLGSFHQSKLSFLRSFLSEFKDWKYSRDLFQLNDKGHGRAVYSFTKNKRTYSLICFANEIKDDERSDRVIATKWDAAFTLFDGIPSKEDIDRLMCGRYVITNAVSKTSKMVKTAINVDDSENYNARKKKDFIGKRSLSRSAFTKPDREKIVGVVPLDKTTSIPEGSYIVKDPKAKLPNPKLGHVSASCWSVEYDNPFSLAIIKDGKNMIGQKLFAMSPLKNKTIPVEIVSSHYVDPKGERVRS